MNSIECVKSGLGLAKPLNKKYQQTDIIEA